MAAGSVITMNCCSWREASHIHGKACVDRTKHSDVEGVQHARCPAVSARARSFATLKKSHRAHKIIRDMCLKDDRARRASRASGKAETHVQEVMLASESRGRCLVSSDPRSMGIVRSTAPQTWARSSTKRIKVDQCCLAIRSICHSLCRQRLGRVPRPICCEL